MLKIRVKHGKYVSKYLGGKFSQKLINHSKQSATDTLKTTSKRVIQKTAKPTGDLICNEMTGAVAKSFDGKNSQQNNLETVAKETDKEMP